MMKRPPEIIIICLTLWVAACALGIWAVLSWPDLSRFLGTQIDFILGLLWTGVIITGLIVAGIGLWRLKIWGVYVFGLLFFATILPTAMIAWFNQKFDGALLILTILIYILVVLRMQRLVHRWSAERKMERH